MKKSFEVGTPLIATPDGFKTCFFGYIISGGRGSSYSVYWSNGVTYWADSGKPIPYTETEISFFYDNYLFYIKNFLK